MILTITAGIQKDRENKAISEVNRHLRDIRKYIALTVGGYTEVDTRGGWVNDAGELIEEKGKQWIILVQYADDATVTGIADFIGKKLNQESVMVQTSEEFATLRTIYHEVQRETA